MIIQDSLFMRVLRRLSAPRAAMAATRTAMHVEEIEPRILHSADFAPFALTDLSGQQQIRVIDAAESRVVQSASVEQSSTRELVVVDASTAGYAQLVEDLESQAAAGRDLEIVLIQPGDDGIRQITDALSRAEGISAIHLISHGGDGAIRLGASTLDAAALQARAAEIASWSRALSADADLLIYGCDVAATPEGRLFVDALARLTGADIAASDDLTGSALLGGDWVLEYRAGAVEASVVLSVAAQTGWQGTLPSDTVLQSHDVPVTELDDTSYEVKTGQSWGQTFRHNSAGATYELDKFAVVLSRAADAAPSQTITLSVRSSWNGAPIASGVMSSNGLTTTETWITSSLGSPLMLNDNQTYYIRVDVSGAGKVYAGVDSTANYAAGDLINQAGAAQSGKDMAFRVIDVTTAAPVLSGANDFPAMNEDPSSNNGRKVSEIISGMVTDSDAGALSGIAVTAVDDTNGTWEYTTNGGGAWTAFGAVTESAARLLTDAANTSVRFVPDSNWHGTVAGGITFRAWDRTSGVAGGVAAVGDASYTVRDNFNAVAYTNNNGSESWSMDWLDSEDANAGAGAISVTGNELRLQTLIGSETIEREVDLTRATSAILSFSYNNALTAGLGNVVVSVSNNGGTSYTTLTSAIASGSGSLNFDISAYIASNTRIRFQMDGVVAGGTFTADDIEIAYVRPLNGGTTAFSAATASASVTVTSVNDRPIGTDAPIVLTEGTSVVFTTASFGFTDPGDTPANALLNVQINTLPVSGTLTLSGIAVTAGQSISQFDIVAGNLRYTPAVNSAGAGYATLAFKVQDDGGGTDIDSTNRTLTFNLTSVNDAPVGTTGTITAIEDTTFVFNAASFGFTDPNDTPANNFASVEITALTGAGSLKLSGVAVSGTQSVTLAQIIAGNLVFDAAPGTNGTGYASFTFRVKDDGLTASGGIDLDTIARTLTINVASTNDAPTGADATRVINEDTDLVFATADFGFSDPGDTPANGFLSVKIGALPAAGTLKLNGVAVIAGQSVLATDIALGKLIFTPVPNANGAGYASFTFQVRDDGGVGSGAVDLDPVQHTMTIGVTSVNDAPTGANRTVVMLEDAELTLTLADFGYTDAGDTPADSFTAVRIASLPSAGTLELNGVAVIANQSVSAADITAGKLVYAPSPNANGANYASFTFRVQDTGGVASGGIDLDTIARTLTIDVTSVNDTPAGADATLVISEDTDLVFATADFGFSDPADTPANGFLSVKIGALPAAGTLKLNGAAVTAGQSVLATDIALGRLIFTPVPNAHGAGYTSFTFQVRDDGGVGSGAIDLDPVQHTMTIGVTSVNDAPTGANRTVVMLEDAELTLTLADFGYTDAGDTPADGFAAVRIASLPAAGTLELNGVAVIANQSVSAADIAAGRLVYSPIANAHGAAYASFTFVVQDDGGIMDGGIDRDTIARTLTIDVTSFNDTPAGADATRVVLEDTDFVFGTADFGFSDPADAPATSLLSVKIGAVPAAGTLKLNGVAVTAGQSVLAADIAAGRLIFTPVPNAHGAGYASFTFQVRDGGGTAGGAIDLDPVRHTMRINVTSVNDAPSGASGAVTTGEDTRVVFGTEAFGFTDAGDAQGNSLRSLEILSLGGAGVLTLDGVAVSAGQQVSAADIAAGKLGFAPNADEHGTGYASFTFRLRDDGGVAAGGIDADLYARTMTINVTPINDAPAGSDRTVTTDEDTAFIFDAAVFGFSDPDDASAHSALSVKITTLPAAGTLTLNGVALAAGERVSFADIVAGALAFNPVADASGAAYASFTFQVQDDGGVQDGGVDLDPIARTLTMDVVAVYDAPPAVIEPSIEMVAMPVVAAQQDTVQTSASTASAAPAAAASASATATTVTAMASAVPAATDTAAAAAESGDAPSGEAAAGAAAPSVGAEAQATGATGGTASSAQFVQVGVQRQDAQQPAREFRGPALVAVQETQLIAPDRIDAGGSMSVAASTFQNATTASSAAAAAVESRAMVQELDQMREGLQEHTKFEASVTAASAAAGMSFSVGYVVWMLRGGVLVSTLLSSLPAWRLVDPLPVLGRMDDDGDDDGDDDSLESLVARNNAASDEPASGLDAPARKEPA